MLVKDAIILKYDVLRQIRMQRMNGAGKDTDLSTNSEMSNIAQAMKLKGEHSLVLDDEILFVVCISEECIRYFLKKKRENVGKICKLCICKDRRGNTKRCSEQKEANRDLRATDNSRVNFSHLDNTEATQRTRDPRPSA